MNNATRVSRKLGTMMLGSFLLLAPARAGEIVATLKGTISNGSDSYGYFGTTKIVGNRGYRDLKGEPFTIVFTFDDSKGKPMASNCTTSGLMGDGVNSPGKATITINGRSRTFGAIKDTHSEVWRSIKSNCSQSQIGFEVHDGQGFNETAGINVRLMPPEGKSLTQTNDWRSPIQLPAVDNYRSSFLFGNNFSSVTGEFSIESVVIEAH